MTSVFLCKKISASFKSWYYVLPRGRYQLFRLLVIFVLLFLLLYFIFAVIAINVSPYKNLQTVHVSLLSSTLDICLENMSSSKSSWCFFFTIFLWDRFVWVLLQGKVKTKWTISTHWTTDCLLYNRSTNLNKYVVEQNIQRLLISSSVFVFGIHTLPCKSDMLLTLPKKFVFTTICCLFL